MTRTRHPQFFDAMLALIGGAGMVGLMWYWRSWFSWSWWMYGLGFIFVAAGVFGRLTQSRAMKNLANKDIQTP